MTFTFGTNLFGVGVGIQMQLIISEGTLIKACLHMTKIEFSVLTKMVSVRTLVSISMNFKAFFNPTGVPLKSDLKEGKFVSP